MTGPLNVARCLHLYGLLVALCAAAFWAMDGYTDPTRRTVVAGSAPAGEGEAPRHAGSGRAFVLIIDSLRDETAINPAIMPATSAFRSRALWGRMLPSRDAVTVPALRAAFTGRDRLTVFGFIRNLWHGEEGFASLLSQLEAAGRRAAVYSDGSFRQFGGGALLELFPIDPVRRREIEAESQEQQVLAALEAYRSGGYDLVVAHVPFPDHEAHRVGIHHPDYAASFGRADALVRLLEESVPPEDTFVVFGDHGHDERGRHMMGLDVPTIAFARGPGFRAGLDIGPIPITDVRYLLSFALKLPLAHDYEGGRHPGGLISDGPLPQEYAIAFDALAAHGHARVDVQQRFLAPYAATVIALALLVAAWIVLALEPGLPGRRIALVWLAAALFAMPWMRLAATIASIGAAAAALLWPGPGRPRSAALRWAAAGAGAMVLLVGWGWVLASIRPSFLALSDRQDLPFPRFSLWVPTVMAAVVAGIPLALRFGAVRPAWALFVVGGVLAYPTVYHYGAPGSMAPVWAALLLYVFLENARARRRAGQPVLQQRDWAAVAALLLLLPFAFAQGESAQFTRWFGPVADAIFPREGKGGSLAIGIAVAVAAKLVLFVRRGTRRLTPVAGAVVAIALAVVEILCLDRQDGGAVRSLWVGAIVAAAAAWLAIRRWRGRRTT